MKAPVHNGKTTTDESGRVEDRYDVVAESHLSNPVTPEPSSPMESLSPFNGAGKPRLDWSRRDVTPKRSSVTEKKSRIEVDHEL